MSWTHSEVVIPAEPIPAKHIAPSRSCLRCNTHGSPYISELADNRGQYARTRRRVPTCQPELCRVTSGQPLLADGNHRLLLLSQPGRQHPVDIHELLQRIQGVSGKIYAEALKAESS